MSKRRPGQRRTLKPWTVAVYMIADGLGGKSDGKLDDSARAAKDEIEAALASARAAGSVNVAIQLDFKTTRGTERAIAGGHDWISHRRDEDAGDPAVLERFFRWVKAQCPAEHYLVHLWGHASGPTGLFFDQAQAGARPDALTLAELGYSFDHASAIFGKPVEIALFKNCWLSLLEAAFELRDGARFMVASQSQVPIERWPYEDIFRVLVAETDAATVAETLVDILGEHYEMAKNRASRDEIPFAAIDIDVARGVDGPLKALANRLAAVRHHRVFAASRVAMRRASLGDPTLLDVLAMCTHLAELSDSELRSHAEDLRNAVAASIVNRRPDPSVFRGVSVLYLPPYETDPAEHQNDSFIAPPFFRSDLNAAGDYRTLELSAHTRWDRIALENFVAPAKTSKERNS
jgi:hypothetical protein